MESGIVFGFFLPGDSLLFTAGLLASQHYMDITGLILVSVAAAILGNNAGYYTGKIAGPSLFNKPKSLWFSPKRVKEGHEFFEKRGPQSLILARFIPAVRTFVPIMAGVARMPYRSFFRYNALGALLWGISLPLLGYSLGKTVPDIDKYLLPGVFLIILASAVPVIIAYTRKNRKT
ncbi:DedA family protein [Candidatus Saccharibacteria bacterium]|nr:DedA family protein [Candidatus Saccharibacteria bacterium]